MSAASICTMLTLWPESSHLGLMDEANPVKRSMYVVPLWTLNRNGVFRWRGVVLPGLRGVSAPSWSLNAHEHVEGSAELVSLARPNVTVTSSSVRSLLATSVKLHVPGSAVRSAPNANSALARSAVV